MSDSLINLIIIVVAIVILAILFKAFAKAILILGLVYIFFHVGFLWDATEVQEALHVFSFLKPAYRQQIEDGYSDFADKRDKYGIVDTEKVEQAIDDAIKDTITKAQKELSEVDIDKALNELKEKLKNFDPQMVEDALDEIQAELEKHNNAIGSAEEAGGELK